METMTEGLTWDDLAMQLNECGIQTLYDFHALAGVVVRTARGDHHIAAAHLAEGRVLVLDMGQKVKGA